MFNSFKKTDKVQAFWNWFAQNKQTFEYLEADRDWELDQKLNSIFHQLQQIQPGLSYEISGENRGLRELTISAEGDIDKFAMVKEIVAQAPVISGWKVVAFRQPTTSDFTLRIQDLELTPAKLYFIPYVEDGSLDIAIVGEGFKNHPYDRVRHYGLSMLINLIGEYNAITKVRGYDFQDLETITDKADLRPLIQINYFLEEFYQYKS